MQIVAPDLLVELRELPLLAKIFLATVGLGLWSVGWWTHRFWVVAATTFGAGFAGLQLAPDFNVQPVVAGLLAAVAAGMLALSLARVAVFAGCGVGCWYVMLSLAPRWAEPLVCVPAGGLLGILMFRFWIILLSSAAGALLLLYGGLVLAPVVAKKLDPVAWAEAHALWLNIGFGVTVLFGLIVQYFIERLRRRFRERWEEWEYLQKKERYEQEEHERRSWFRWRRRAA